MSIHRPFRVARLPVAAAVLAALVLAPSEAYARRRVDGSEPPAPKLVSPGDTARPGQGPLVFRWSCESTSGHRHDDFRLYSGVETVESSLILQRDVAPKECRVEVDPAALPAGDTYVWSVRRVGSSGKSRKVFSVFRIER